MTTQPKTRRNRSSIERVSHFAIGYLRVSTVEQVKSGAGLDAQRAAIELCAAQRGLQIIAWHVDEGVSGGVAPMKRPELAKALEALRTGPASVLLFGKADRVGRRATDLLALRDRAEKEGWTLASADGAVDLTSPAGRMMFTVLAGVAEMERELIGVRTREGLAAKRAKGVRLGRPATLPADVVQRIVTERENGGGWSAIARGLMADGVLTARDTERVARGEAVSGSKWHASAVQAVYNGQDAQKLRTAV